MKRLKHQKEKTYKITAKKILIPLTVLAVSVLVTFILIKSDCFCKKSDFKIVAAPTIATTENKEKKSPERETSSPTSSSQEILETQETNIPETTTGVIEKESETIIATEAPNTNSVVVVLDPGHDTTVHTRNHPELGFNEQDLNLKIVQSCYDRLTQYEGIEVYLTRTDGTCPDTQYNDCILARTKIATSKNADMFISFHCNATTGVLGATASGSEVYVSHHPDYYQHSKSLGEIILKHISSAVDLSNRGVKTRINSEKGYYDNGTVKDFYYLISNNIDDGQPGIIIEHAYMDNIHDNSILKSDEKLRLIGEADADAIAEFYNLSLK